MPQTAPFSGRSSDNIRRSPERSDGAQRDPVRKRTMRTNLIVRAPVLADFEPWLALWDGYNDFYGRQGPTALPQGISELTWQRFFDESEPVHAFVAEQDGALVGMAHYIFHRSTGCRPFRLPARPLHL